MSRIGKKPIAIPNGVEVKIENNLIVFRRNWQKGLKLDKKIKTTWSLDHLVT